MLITTINDLRSVLSLTKLSKDITIPLAVAGVNEVLLEIDIDGKQEKIYKPKSTRLTRAIVDLFNESYKQHILYFRDSVKYILDDKVKNPEHLEILSELITLNYNVLSEEATTEARENLKKLHGEKYDAAVDFFTNITDSDFKVFVNTELESLDKLEDALESGLSALVRLIVDNQSLLNKYQTWDMSLDDTNLLNYMAYVAYSMILGLVDDKAEEAVKEAVEVDTKEAVVEG